LKKQRSREVKDAEEIEDAENVEEIVEMQERSADRFSPCPPLFLWVLCVKSFELVVAVAIPATRERIE
jgi:hypothetical protein